MPKIISKREWLDRISEVTKGNLDIIGWSDESKFGARCMALARCLTCSFEWESIADNLYRGKGCPCCAKIKRPKSRLTPETKRIDQVNSIGGIEFLGWVDGYKNNHSIVSVKCSIDGTVWSASLSSILSGAGCTCCSIKSRSKKRRLSSAECNDRLESIPNIEFLRWEDGCYENSRSKVRVMCSIHKIEWVSKFSDIVYRRHGCASCAKTGYDPSKTGYLYALRSECGQYVKVGISNNPRERHKQLKRDTPFKFILIEEVAGSGGEIAEIEKHFHDKYNSAGFTGFGGATEWLVCTSELLEEIRDVGQ